MIEACKNPGVIKKDSGLHCNKIKTLMIPLLVNFQTTLRNTLHKSTQHFSPGYQILKIEYQQWTVWHLFLHAEGQVPEPTRSLYIIYDLARSYDKKMKGTCQNNEMHYVSSSTSKTASPQFLLAVLDVN